MNERWYLAVTLAAACGLCAPGARAAAPCTPHSVSVSGAGSARAAPGMYVFHVAVSERGTDIRAANAEVARKSAAVVAAARKAGIAKPDIRSTNVSVSPVYDPKAKPGAAPFYDVTRNITLTLREPAAYAKLVESLVNAGVNRISGVEARPADPEALSDQALAAAVADARRKAALVAAGLGVRLGPALDVQENGAAPRPLVMGAMQARSAESGGYEPGEITASANVSARFALSPSGCPAQ